MTDPDVQYLRDLAKGYANSFIDGCQAEYRRMNAIADRLEHFVQAEGAKKVGAWAGVPEKIRSGFDTLPDDYETGDH